MEYISEVFLTEGPLLLEIFPNCEKLNLFEKLKMNLFFFCSKPIFFKRFSFKISFQDVSEIVIDFTNNNLVINRFMINKYHV